MGKEDKAKEYAEQHNIQGYTVKGNRMIYYVNSPNCARTEKVTVHLDGLRVERQILTYWNKKGDLNFGR